MINIFNSYINYWLVALYMLLTMGASAQATYDLTTMEPTTAPSGGTLEWHNALPASNANIVPNSKVAAPGLYYAVYNFGNDCYSAPSPAKVLEVTCAIPTVDLTKHIDSAAIPNGMQASFHTAAPVGASNVYAGDVTKAPIAKYFVAYHDPSRGCYTTGSPIVVIEDIAARPVGSASAQTICFGETTSIVLNSTTSGTGYSWTAAVTSGSVEGFSDGSDSLRIAQTLYNGGTTNAIVTYTVTPTANGCAGKPFTVDATVKPAVRLTINDIPSQCTFNSPIELKATPAGGAWSGKGVSGTKFSPAVAGEGMHTIKYQLTSNGCTDSTKIVIKVVDCTDFDGDGIPNSDDIDDDNDGVLDTQECPDLSNALSIQEGFEDYVGCPDYSAGTTITNATGWSTNVGAGGQLMVYDPGVCMSNAPSTVALGWPASTRLTGGSEAKNWGGYHGGENAQFDLERKKLKAGITYTLKVDAGWVKADRVHLGPADMIITGIPIKSADFSDDVTYRIAKFDVDNRIQSSDQKWVEYTITFTPKEDYNRIIFTNEGGYLYFDNLRINHNVDINTCDTDNDGRPNVYDLDSDGDGCTDAVEAGTYSQSGVTTSAGSVSNGTGGSVTSISTKDNAIINGPYGGNGFADILQKASPDTNQYNYTYTYNLAVDGRKSINCIPPPIKDTVIVTPPCDTCRLTVCPIVDGLDTSKVITYSLCNPADTSKFKITQDPATGCVTFKPKVPVTDTAENCIIGCDGSRCDTTVVIIVPPAPTKDTVEVTPKCDTCSVRACATGDDVNKSEPLTFSECGKAGAGMTVSGPDADGCYTYKPTTPITDTLETCVIVCDGNRCDTTVIVIVPPAPTKDTVEVTPKCDTCSVRACPTGDDVNKSEPLTFSECGKAGAGMAVSGPDADGCYTYKPTTTITDTIETCVIVCDGNRCDTTVIVIVPPAPTKDTVEVTPKCDTCSVRACPTGDDVNKSEPLTFSECGKAGAGMAVSGPDAKGCYTYKPTTPITDTLETCVIVCDGNRCDTTVIVILPPPPISDTITLVPTCNTCSVKACATGDDVNRDNVLVFSECGKAGDKMTVTGPDAKGCYIYKPKAPLTDTINSCVIVCDGNRCDTTFVMVVPPPPTGDTIVVTPPCDTCSETICPSLNDLDTSKAITYNLCNPADTSKFKLTQDPATGCVTFKPKVPVTDTTKNCIIGCDGKICDTTVIVIVPPPPTKDTMVVTPSCDTCSVRGCATGDDVNRDNVLVFSECGKADAGMTVSGPDAKGCYTYKPTTPITDTIETCVIVCDGKRCDTTVIVIVPPAPTKDTVEVTPKCDTCSVRACPTGDDVNKSEPLTFSECGKVDKVMTVSGPDAIGCYVYKPKVPLTDTIINSCVIVCDGKRCDTTIVVIVFPKFPKPVPLPPTKDTVKVTPPCPDCFVTACPVINDIDTSGGGITYTTCGLNSNIGYTISQDPKTGCLKITPTKAIVDTNKTCIITCKGNRCDTTIVIIYPPSPFALGSCPNNMNVCINGGVINLAELKVNPSGGTWSGNGVTSNRFDPVVAGNGLHLITYRYTDTSETPGTCTFNINVGDTVKPTIVKCADAKTVDTTEGCNGKVPDFTADVIATDNCSSTSNGITISQSPAAGSIVATGATPVVITVSDAFGNVTRCTTSVTIRDLKKPVISCPKDIVVNAENSGCEVKFTIPELVYTDNCRVARLTWKMTGATVANSPDSGINQVEGNFEFGSGKTTITYYVYDNSANVDSCSLTITVNGTISATIDGDVACANSTGVLTVNAIGGKQPYTYSINGGTFQTENQFIAVAGRYKVVVKDDFGCTTTVAKTVEANPAITLTAITTDMDCNGNLGTLKARAAGGTPGYTYKVGIGNYQSDSMFINLNGGSYVVTVKDAKGCTADIQATIQSNNKISAVALSTTPSDVECKGEKTGSITLNAEFSGSVGTLSSTYKWYEKGNPDSVIATTKDLIKIPAGSYFVEIAVSDSKNPPCISKFQAEATVADGKNSIQGTITGNRTVQLNSTPEPKVTFDATGGTAPYRYTYTINRGADSMITSDSGVTVSQPTNKLGTFAYRLTKVQDSKGCTVEYAGKKATIDVIEGIPVPDLTPELALLPTIVHGVTLMSGTVRIDELGAVPTEGEIAVFITKDSKLTMQYDSTATSIGDVDVENKDWKLDVTANLGFYKFTTERTMSPKESTSFGFHMMVDSGQSIGELQVSASIRSLSGGEINLANNIDTELIVYFIN